MTNHTASPSAIRVPLSSQDQYILVEETAYGSFQETLFPPNQFFFQFILSQWIHADLFINNELMLEQAQKFDERGQDDLLYTINSLILWG